MEFQRKLSTTTAKTQFFGEIFIVLERISDGDVYICKSIALLALFQADPGIEKKNSVNGLRNLVVIGAFDGDMERLNARLCRLSH